MENTTVLDRQIEILNKCFKNPKIIIITGFKYKKIKNHIKHYPNTSIIINEDFETTNDLYSIGLALKSINKQVLLIQDNLIFKEDVFKPFKKTESQIFTNLNQKFELGCIVNSNNTIDNVSWGLPNYLCNISYFYNAEFDSLKYISNLESTKKWFIVEGLNWIIKNGGHFTNKSVKTSLRIVDKINA